jgi:hypothetical protein
LNSIRNVLIHPIIDDVRCTKALKDVVILVHEIFIRGTIHTRTLAATVMIRGTAGLDGRRLLYAQHRSRVYCSSKHKLTLGNWPSEKSCETIG